MEFSERYGPWALIAGASEGTGRAFAKRVAAQGVSCILIANGGPLEDTADEIRRESGVEVITARIDLSAPDAGAYIIAAAGEREVGLYVSNAGADRFGDRFLDRELDDWLALSRINVDTMLACSHYFGRQMRTRRKGGILIVNSGACYGGGKFLAIYCGAKGYQLNFAEALWSELRPYGVDVLTLVLGQTDTPAYHRLQARKGMPPGPNLAPADVVAEEGLAHLANGPVRNWGRDDEDAILTASAASRRRNVLFMEEAIKHVFGDQPGTDLA
jgi:short-subunit dehydrogenase